MSKAKNGKTKPEVLVKGKKEKPKVDRHLASRRAWLVIYKAKADKAEGKEKEKLLEKRAKLAAELGIKLE